MGVEFTSGLYSFVKANKKRNCSSTLCPCYCSQWHFVSLALFNGISVPYGLFNTETFFTFKCFIKIIIIHIAQPSMASKQFKLSNVTYNACINPWHGFQVLCCTHFLNEFIRKIQTSDAWVRPKILCKMSHFFN